MTQTNGQNRLPSNPNSKEMFEECELREIYLAGGCFWGVEAFMARIPGVAETIVGYANGTTENPTYEAVCRNDTGYAETVWLKYDPNQIPLERLLFAFFSIIDPTSKNRQGGDVGTQYRTGVYYTVPEDISVAEKVFAKKQTGLEQPIVVELEPLSNFYRAEEYHQKYLEKNPNGYCHVDFSKLTDVK